MYVLEKNGVKGKLWLLIKKLNENLQAQVRTAYGKTRKISIKDSIRQGGVLAPLLYALLMDEINKEISDKKLGIAMKTAAHIIGCLLWMDDVVLASTDKEEMQQMLDITNEITQRYHIEFGEAKTKAMTIGLKKSQEKPNFNIGSMNIQHTDNYTYLGNVFNEKDNMKDHMKHINGKVEAAYQTIMTMTGNPEFNNIEMEIIWKLLEACIQPIMTYGGETWDPTKQELIEINRAMDKIIKRILMTPPTTPREALYMETGLLDNEHIIARNRINMQVRLDETQNNLIKSARESGNKGGWEEKTEKVKKQMKIKRKDTENRVVSKKKIQKRVKTAFKKTIEESGEQKTKVKYLKENKGRWKAGVRETYMNKLTRHQASIIFRARTRMIKFKDNFRAMYKDSKCRLCSSAEETQEHILECSIASEGFRVRKEEIFSKNTAILKNAARKLRILMEKLEIN
jgi:hypothetical protein